VALLTAISLCSGYGGLEIGVDAALGGRLNTICYVEREVAAAACLIEKMESGRLHPAPIWDDVTTFDGRPWRGKVDIVTAGFSCQPFSCAGKRGGFADERFIFDDIARIIGEVRPSIVFLENVADLLSMGPECGHIFGTLAALGFDLEWLTLSAAAVGASHKRERLFILAYSNNRRTRKNKIGKSNNRFIKKSENLADASGAGLAQRKGERRNYSKERAAPERSSRSLFAPGPNSPDWPAIIAERPDLAPAIESEIRRVASGTAGRVDQLRMLGNGVVPLQAAVAFGILADHAGLDLAKKELNKWK